MNKKPLLFALSALILASCNGGGSGDHDDSSAQQTTHATSSISHASGDASLEESTDSESTEEITSAEEDTSEEELSSTHEDSSAEEYSSIDSSEEAGPDWTDEEKEAMRNALHGEVLPFIGLSDYQDSSTQFSICFVAQVDDEGFFDSYAALLEADGWTAVDDDRPIEREELYVYEKAMDVNGDTRYAWATFSCWDDGSDVPSTTGTMYLRAYDPYDYGFPAERIASTALRDYNVEVNLPTEIAAERFIQGWIDGRIHVECYGIDVDGADAYADSLITAGFKYIGKRQGTVIFESENGDYNLLLAFDADTSRMSIEISPIEVQLSVMEQLEAFFAKYNQPVPEGMLVAYPDDGDETFSFAEDPNNEEYLAMGDDNCYKINATVTISDVDEDTYAAFMQSLDDAGWAEDIYHRKNHMVYMREAGDMFVMEAVLDSAENVATLTYYVYPDVYRYTSWPASKIAALLPAGTTDAIPAFNGDFDSVTVYYDKLQHGMVINVETATDSQARASMAMDYFAALTQAGFTPFLIDVDDGIAYGKSEHNQIALSLGYADNGFDIIFYNHFIDVATEVLKYLPNLTPQDLPPLVFDQSQYFYTAVDTDYLEMYGCVDLTCFTLGETDPGQLFDAYRDSLLAEGYVYDSVNWVYISPNGKVAVEMVRRGRANSISVYDVDIARATGYIQ